MNLEIERKFLIAYPDERLLKSVPGSSETEIFQTYLLCADGSLRIRKRGANGVYQYTKTLKRDKTKLTREEYENVIDEGEYARLLKQADPRYNTLYKRRWRIPYAGFIYEVDIYPFWTKQAIMEVELPTENTQIPPLPFVRILREVSDDRRYSNRSMARFDFKPDFDKGESI